MLKIFIKHCSMFWSPLAFSSYDKKFVEVFNAVLKLNSSDGSTKTKKKNVQKKHEKIQVKHAVKIKLSKNCTKQKRSFPIRTSSVNANKSLYVSSNSPSTSFHKLSYSTFLIPA